MGEKNPPPLQPPLQQLQKPPQPPLLQPPLLQPPLQLLLKPPLRPQPKPLLQPQ